MSRQSISEAIARRAQCGPGEVVACDRTTPIRASQLDERATALAAVLHEAGVTRDDIVIVALPNSVDFVLACAGIWRAGATPMPLSPLTDAPERRYLEQLARPVAAFGTPALTPGVSQVTVDDQPSGSISALQQDDWASCWKAVTSSGSTGRPKIIRAAAPALVDPEVPAAPFLPNHSVQLITSPLWHSAAFTYAFRGLTHGHRLVIEPRFDERSFLQVVAHHAITWTMLTPAAIHRLLRVPSNVRSEANLASLRTVVHLGARCSVPDKQALLTWLGPERVVEVYAGSESNGLTMIRGDEWLTHPGSVGKPFGGTVVEIRDDAGIALPPNCPGTIWMRRGHARHYSYLGAPSRRDAAGWDTLGDLGYRDREGYLYILDRADDVVLRAGALIYPADIEQAIEEHPAVRGAVATGDTDALGNTVVLVVADVGDTGTSGDELRMFADSRLPAVSRPDRIVTTDRPLRNDAGKVRRRSLRHRQTTTEATRDRSL